VRLKLGIEPEFAREVVIGEIQDHRTPHREIDPPLDLLGHCACDRYRKGKRIEVCERSIDAHKRCAHTSRKPHVALRLFLCIDGMRIHACSRITVDPDRVPIDFPKGPVSD
jgi:hypothetical protein